ncbi:ankyrin, partial [Tuber magnatum]
DQPPLHLAARFMSGAYKTLVAKASPSLLTAPDEYGNTPLHEAAISGHWPMLVGLVRKFATPQYKKHGDQINKRNRSGNTPLHLAFQFDHPDMVKFLVENHADPTIKNNEEVT